MIEEFRARLHSEWRKVDYPAEEAASGPIVWIYRVSPPFPAAWPPDRDRNVYYYVYAAGNNLHGGLSDGEHVAAPWARIAVRGETSELEFLSGKLREIGVQGVGLLARDEAGIYAQADKMEPYLLRLGSLPDDVSPETQMLKMYYCLWISHNGVIVGELRPQQEAFIIWLGCK